MQISLFCSGKRMVDAVIYSILSKDATKLWLFSGKYIWEYDLLQHSIIDFGLISDFYPNMTVTPSDIDASYSTTSLFNVVIKVSTIEFS